jgi:hypothetical protein
MVRHMAYFEGKSQARAKEPTPTCTKNFRKTLVDCAKFVFCLEKKTKLVSCILRHSQHTLAVV